MIHRIKALFRSRPNADELRYESRALLLERLRVGVVLALVFIPLFIPLDFVRIPDRFAGALLVRIGGSMLLLALFPVLSIKAVEPWAEWLAALAVTLVAGTILGIARFAAGAADPVYLAQAMAIVFLITGSALLLPLDGRRTLLIGSIPVGLQVLMTLDYQFLENLPIVLSSVTALIVATVGAQTAFLSRLGEYEGRRSKEALLEARSEIVAILTHEVEEQKTTEEVLRKSEQKYRSLFEEYRDGLILSLADGQLIDANPAVLQLFGYEDKQEFLALRSHELYYENPERDRARLMRLLASNDFSLRDVDLDLKRKDGRKVSVVVSSSPVRDEAGQITGFRTILRDMTEKKLLESRLRQTQKLEAVGLLAAGVAHEINNPLTYVITHLETMQEDLRRLTPGAPDRSVLESILARIREASEGAARVRRIVRDLKTFARLGGEELAPVDVEPLLEKALKLAAPEILFRARVRQDLHTVPPVLGNEGQLLQVVVNLLINAAQAIEEGEVDRNEISLRVTAADQEVVLEVSDTGTGIAPEHVDRLFEPFFTTKSSNGGSGLGLSICYNIVTSYGGRIEVKSRVGAGSSFFVHLPLAPAERQPAVEENLPVTAARRGRVLVVDDEPFVLSTVKIILGRTHDVVGLGSGTEALRLLDKDDRFDVILCDLIMKGSSGMEVHAELCKRAPALASRLVFMTGGAFTPWARRFLESVPNPCIDKPFGTADLINVIEQVMAGGAKAGNGGGVARAPAAQASSTA